MNGYLKRIILIISIIFAFYSIIYGEINYTNQKSFYIELFGFGRFYSINYDHVFYRSNLYSHGYAVGISFWPYYDFSKMIEEDIDPKEITSLWMITPIRFINLIGNNKNKLELDLVTVFSMVFRNDFLFDMGISAVIGYRYQNIKGGLNFRAFFSPIFIVKYGFYPWGGISIGYSLKLKKRSSS